MLLSRWNLWIALVGAAFVLVVAAHFWGHARGWDARARLAAAETEALIAEAEAQAAQLQAQLNAAAAEISERTHARSNAAAAAVVRGREEIENAARTQDPDALYAAWAAARDRVWYDAGLGPTAGSDSGAPGAAPVVRATHDA